MGAKEKALIKVETGCRKNFSGEIVGFFLTALMGKRDGEGRHYSFRGRRPRTEADRVGFSYCLERRALSVLSFGS